MYQSSYAEILIDSAADARRHEWRALDHAATLLDRAAAAERGAAIEGEAVRFATELWAILIHSLAGPENDLPGELRAALMGVGIGIMTELARTDANAAPRDLPAVAAICRIVRDGLA